MSSSGRSRRYCWFRRRMSSSVGGGIAGAVGVGVGGG